MDSDNDGMPNIIEAGGEDADGDGRVDDSVDANNDGLDDAVAAFPWDDGDFDNDGVADRLDIDSDNDGMPDLAEAAAYDADADADGRVDEFVDENGDGLDDGFASAPIVIDDLDGDGSPDHLALDSDNDGIADVIEIGLVDADGNGQVDGEFDENGYATVFANRLQEHPLVIGLADVDGNGVADIDDAAVPDVGAPAPALPDSDVLTGLSGHGCSVGDVDKLGAADPTLSTFMGLSMFMMAWRAVR